MPSSLPRALCASASALLLFAALTRAAASYTLEFMDKWGTSYFQTFGPVSSTPGGPSAATVTWSYITDGAGINTTNYTDGTLDGVSHVGSLRAAVDAAYGTGAFNAAAARAFAAWAAAGNITFNPVADNGAAFAGTYAINIRIGAYDFMAAADSGGVGYGPPRDAINFPNDPLAGQISFAYSFTSSAAPLPLWTYLAFGLLLIGIGAGRCRPARLSQAASRARAAST